MNFRIFCYRYQLNLPVLLGEVEVDEALVELQAVLSVPHGLVDLVEDQVAEIQIWFYEKKYLETCELYLANAILFYFLKINKSFTGAPCGPPGGGGPP